MLEKIKIVFNGIISKIKAWLVKMSKLTPITDQEIYNKTKAWLIKALIICGICSILGILYAVEMTRVLEIPGIMCFVIGEWSSLAFATFILNIGEIFNIDKICFLGELGFNIGKDFEKTNVSVDYQSNDTYEVSTYTSNNGCLFAIIAIGLRFFGWIFLSIYLGPIITVSKLILTVDEMKKYQKNQV